MKYNKLNNEIRTISKVDTQWEAQHNVGRPWYSATNKPTDNWTSIYHTLRLMKKYIKLSNKIWCNSKDTNSIQSEAQHKVGRTWYSAAMKKPTDNWI